MFQTCVRFRRTNFDSASSLMTCAEPATLTFIYESSFRPCERRWFKKLKGFLCGGGGILYLTDTAGRYLKRDGLLHATKEPSLMQSRDTGGSWSAPRPNDGDLVLCFFKAWFEVFTFKTRFRSELGILMKCWCFMSLHTCRLNLIKKLCVNVCPYTDLSHVCHNLSWRHPLLLGTTGSLQSSKGLASTHSSLWVF